MIFSIVTVVSILALLPSSLTLPLDTRKGDCSSVCPQNDVDGHELTASGVMRKSITCTYAGGSGNLCIYDIFTDALTVEADGCPEQAVRQCSSSHRPNKNVPSQNRSKREDSQPDLKAASSPSPNLSTEKSGSKPSKEQPAGDFKCPQKDLAKGSLTNEAVRDSALGCSYSTSDCKYNTKTGLLLEDRDGDHCPQTATPSQKLGYRQYI